MTNGKLWLVICHIFILITILALLPLPSLAQTQVQGNGIIQGQLVNKTPNGQNVPELPLELKIFMNGNETNSVIGKTNTQGKFEFSGLPVGPQYEYQMSFNYLEADYIKYIPSFKQNETTVTIEIPVWDSTDDDKAINIASAHYIVQFDENSLRITEYYRVVNTGDKAYIGSNVISSLGKKETLRFHLPANAQDIQLAMGLMDCCIAIENQTLVDTIAVEPGGKEIAFIYMVEISKSKYVLPIIASRDINALSLVVEDKGAKVSSPQLSSPQLTKMGNTSVIRLVKSDVKKGDNIQVTLSDIPGANDSMSNLRWAGIALIVMAVGFGIGYPLLRRKSASSASTEVTTQEDRTQLLQDIAQLDDAFDAGQIDKDEYQQQRSEKMASLLELNRQK